MRRILFVLVLLLSGLSLWAGPVAVTHDKLMVDVPDLDGSLSTWLPGTMGYPLPRYEPSHPFLSKPKELELVCLENEYLKVRFIPDFGARVYDLIWKKNGASPVFQKKKADFGTMYGDEGLGYMVHFGSIKWGFPFFGHTATDHMPWQYEVIRLKSGGAVFHAWRVENYVTGLRMDTSITLEPGATALKTDFKISNPTDRTKVWDLWVDMYVPCTEFVELALPTDRVITHQSAWNFTRNMIIPWPFLGNVDMRYLRAWHDSNGVFPLAQSDQFSGFYLHDRQLGMFRTFEPGKTIGTKFWFTNPEWYSDFGEMFTGGEPTHDERAELLPGAAVEWKEQWMVLHDLKGIDCGNSDLACHLESDENGTSVFLEPVRPLGKVDLTVETAGVGNGRTSVLGQWHGSLDTIEPRQAKLPVLPPYAGYVVCRIKYSDKTYSWTTSGELVKRPFVSDKLSQARLDYQKSLKGNGAKNTVASNPDSGQAAIPVKTAYKKSKLLTAEKTSRLFRPNAACRLADGSFVVADANLLLHFDADLKYLGRWGDKENLFSPLGLACDGQGRLLVADTGNRRILRLTLSEEWKIDKSWDVQERCGEVCWHQGTIAYTCPLSGKVMSFSDEMPEGKVEAKCLAKDLQGPLGVCFDGDEVVVCDTLHSRVLKLAKDGSFQVLTGPKEGLVKPSRVCSRDGGLLISDAGRACLLSWKDGVLKTVVDGTNLNNISLSVPGGLAAAGQNLFLTIADPARLVLLDQNYQLSKSYDVNDNGGPYYSMPSSVAVLPDGRKIVLDSGGGRVRIFDANGKQTGLLDSWGWDDGQLWKPSCVRADSKGYVYISDLLNFRVQRFDPSLTMRDALELKGVRTESAVKTSTWYSHGIAVGPDDKLYVADHAHQCVHVYSPAPENKPLQTIQLGRDVYPLSVAVDNQGRVIVANSFRSEVVIYDPNSPLTLDHRGVGFALLQPLHVAWDKEGGYFISGRKAQTDALLHFNSRHTLAHSFTQNEVYQAEDIVWQGDGLVVASPGDQGFYKVSQDDKASLWFRYSGQQTIPGKVSSVKAALLFNDGTGVAVDDDTPALHFLGKGLDAMNDTQVLEKMPNWVELFDDELMLMRRGNPVQQILSRHDRTVKKRWFKGVAQLMGAFCLGNDLWLVSDASNGLRLFRGTGDEAVEANAPDWAKGQKIRLMAGVTLRDGSYWFSVGMNGSLQFLHVDHDLKLMASVLQPRGRFCDALLRDPGQGFVAFTSQGVIRYDQNGANPANVLSVPAIFGDITPDNRLLVVTRDGELWLCDPL